MKPTTRTFTVLTAMAMLLAVASTALAKPDRGKPSPPETVSVTMNLVDGQGLNTECSGGAILMERSGNELFPVSDDQIGLHLTGIDTSRQYPEPTQGDGFAGCYGGDIHGEPVPYGGFGITLNDGGEPTDVFWHFEYHLEEEQVNKRRTRVMVMEHFTLSGHGLTWNEGTSTASGWFDVLYHLEERGGESIGYQPVDGSPVFMSFTFDMQRQG
jgi:hypothetical protein